MEKYLIPSFVAFIVTFALTPVMIRVALKIGMVDRPGERRIHREATPRGGGLAIVIGFHLAFLIFVLYGWEQYAFKLNLHWWSGFVLASGLLVVTGLVDDLRGIRPWLKLAGQVSAAVVMYNFGVRFGSLVAVELTPQVDLVLTVLWFVGITNAFNLIDGLDGLATGLALISALGLMGALFFRRLSVDAVVVLMLASACLAFLRYNFHPARIFLGDTGSMFLGFTLAAFALETSSKGTFALTVGVALLAMGIPVFDTLLAIWRRSVRMLAPKAVRDGKRGIMTADAEHLHHRLLDRMGHRQVASLLFGLNAVFVLVALLTVAFKAHALGIFLLAFVIGTYVVVRHLAHVELWDTGAAIVEGLHRPRGRVVVYLLYPMLDLLAMSVILLGCLWLSGGLTGNEKPVDRLLAAWPVWVAPTFLALFVGRIYSRVWSRARFMDYAVLLVAVVGGSSFGLGLHLITESPTLREGVAMGLLFSGLTHLALSSTRLIVRGLRDILSFSALSSWGRNKYNKKPIVLYGSGPRLELFLREKAMGEIDPDNQKVILGILDDDPNLRGRLLNGYRVLGGLESISSVVEKEVVSEIVILDEVSAQVLEELKGLAQDKAFRLTEWLYREEVLCPEAEVAADRSN